jgi:hypothetical protein
MPTLQHNDPNIVQKAFEVYKSKSVLFSQYCAREGLPYNYMRSLMQRMEKRGQRRVPLAVPLVSANQRSVLLGANAQNVVDLTVARKAQARKQKGDPWEGFGIVRDDEVFFEIEEMPWGRVLIVACSQAPLHHPSFLPWLRQLVTTLRPLFIVLNGDVLDCTFGKKEYTGPDYLGTAHEVKSGIAFVQELVEICGDIPVVVTTSNHIEGRMDTMRERGNVPEIFLRQWRDVYGIPQHWRIARYFAAGTHIFEHGHGVSKGARPNIRQEMIRRWNRVFTIVRAHRHTEAGAVMASEWESQTFNRSLYYVGCGMDEAKQSYSRAGMWINSLLIENGAVTPYPMERDEHNQWTGRIINALLDREVLPGMY